MPTLIFSFINLDIIPGICVLLEYSCFLLGQTMLSRLLQSVDKNHLELLISLLSSL